MMDNPLRSAVKYLSPPMGAFWRWEDEGRVVAWTNGATISFREELAAVLQRLARRGLPELDGVLLLIAATRSSWKHDSSDLRERIPNLRQFFLDLDRVHAFPAEHIYSIRAKQELAEAVFESSPCVINADVAAIVCEILSRGMVHRFNYIPNLPRLRGGKVQTTNTLFRSLLDAGFSLQGITSESLRIRYTTGLDEAPLPAEVIVPAEPVVIRSLLQKLAFDEELSGVARIARHLSAVLQLPRAITDSDEMPLGGISDISNRGTLDRLLLSELAHDDLMLATRVALNEALYLRRETPPSPPPRRRHVLVDSGLRLWGVPRVFATGVLLSLAASAPQGSSLLAYRASNDHVDPIDPATSVGLIGHLAVLEPELHPGRALIEFRQRITEDSQPGDAVIVTSDAAMADPEFQRALIEAQLPTCCVATVNRDGEFSLWSLGPRGTRRVTALKLDLEDLLHGSKRAREALVDPTIDSNLPWFFHAESVPLRLPNQIAYDQRRESIWSVRLPDGRQRAQNSGLNPEPVMVTSAADVQRSHEYGVMVLTRDRRLVLFDEPHCGARQIATGVPFGTHLWSGSADDPRISRSLIYRPAERAFYVLEINLIQNRLTATRPLDSNFVAHSGAGSKVLGASYFAGILYVVYSSMIEAFDLETGRQLDQMATGVGLAWAGARFFQDPKAPQFEEWKALSFDGSEIKLQTIPRRGPERSGTILRLFDRVGHDGPFGVHLRGSIANFSNQTEWEWTRLGRPQASVVDISGDGERLLIEQEHEQPNRDGKIFRTRRVLNLDSRQVEVDPNDHYSPWALRYTSLAMWDLKRFRTGETLMHRFVRASVSTTGKLTLTSKSLTNWQFEVKNHGLALVQIAAGTAGLSRSRSFEPAHHPTPGCSMTRAQWEDGSRAFVDARGLLVLQSSDKMIPEAVFVLAASDVAVWTSHGQTIGSPYFLGVKQGQPYSAENVMKEILIPFVERLT